MGFSKKMNMLVLLGSLAITACTSVQFAPSKMGQVYPSRTAPDAIELFRSSAPTKKFIEIGSASACCGGSNYVTGILRKKASETGGDALIGLDFYANGSAMATVIRYQE